MGTATSLPTVVEQVDELVALLTKALVIGSQLTGQQPTTGVEPLGKTENTVINVIDAALEDALCKANAVVGHLEQVACRLG